MLSVLKSRNRNKYISIAVRCGLLPQHVYNLNHGYVRATSDRDRKAIEMIDDSGLSFVDRDINLGSLGTRHHA